MTDSAHGLIQQPSMPTIYGEEELSLDDLDALPEKRGVGTGRLERIRSIHHKIAQMMAKGCAHVEIAAAVGMSPNYMTVLRNDPAFQELLEHYEQAEQEAWADVRRKAALVGLTAVEEIQHRLLENPDKISTKDLRELAKAGLDYGGHKPAERSENVHVVTTKEEIEEIKQGRQENVRVREGESGDDSGGVVIEQQDDPHTTSGEEVREEGVEGDRKEVESDVNSLDRLLG